MAIGRDRVQREIWQTAGIRLQAWEWACLGPFSPGWATEDWTMNYVGDPRQNSESCQLSPGQTTGPWDCAWIPFCCLGPLSLCDLYVAIGSRCSLTAYPDEYMCVCMQLCMWRWVQVSLILQPHGLKPNRVLCPCITPGKNTRVGCLFLLQGIFLTQRSNSCILCLLHWQTDSLPPSHLGR